MSSVHDVVLAHLDSQGLIHAVDPATGAFTYEVTGPHNLTIPVEAHTAATLVVRARFPLFISAVDGHPLIEYVRRANLAEQVGALELAFVDDEVRLSFRTAIDFAGTEPSPVMVARALDRAVGGIIRHSPNISSVAYGVSVDEARPAPPDPFDN